MTRGTIITAVIVGLASLFILTTRDSAGSVSAEGLAAALVYYPTLIASAVIILLALVSLAQRQRIGIAVLCLTLCSALPTHCALEQYRLSKNRKWANWAEIIGLREAQATKEMFSLNGEWICQTDGESKKAVRRFKGDHLIDEDGVEHPWIIENSVITIWWDLRQFERLVLDPKTPDVVKGSNHTGARLTYTRIK